MKLIYAIILGLIQGLTEFLPVSSSGHLVLFAYLFGLETPEESNLFFDVLLHFGTLIAVFAAYRKDITDMIKEFFSWIGSLSGGKRLQNSRKTEEVPPARRLIFLLVIATLPLLLAFPMKGILESIRTKPILVGVALIITGMVLFISDKLKVGHKTERSATWIDVLLVGIAQALAITPGISRSGITISAGLSRKLDRKFAIKFSFLLSIPAVLGATVLSTVDAIKAGIDTAMVPIYLAGMAVAAISGFFAIKLVRYISDRKKFGYFAYYCWLAGLVTIAAVLFAG